MKCSVEIKQALNQWYLIIRVDLIDDVCQVNRLLAFDRLQDALDSACILQLHVDNSAELALNQYRKVI